MPRNALTHIYSPTFAADNKLGIATLCARLFYCLLHLSSFCRNNFAERASCIAGLLSPRSLGVLLAVLTPLVSFKIWAATEIHVATAGTLSSLFTDTPDSHLKVTGVINGSDIRLIREWVVAGTVTSLDWSEVRIVKGGVPYYEEYTTADDIIGERMFSECAKLRTISLPPTLTAIQSNAFSRSGLTKVDVPNSVSHLGGDAFAYCSSLKTVVIGKRVKRLDQGVFYQSPVTIAYVKPLAPPSAPPYLFSSKPTVRVYTEALRDYKDSEWMNYATRILGSLENYYPQEPDSSAIVGTLCDKYFQDAACTMLRPEFQAMTDEALIQAMTEGGMPAFMSDIALKVKNAAWGAYEQDFRIHNYKAYSDAAYWNDRMMSSGGSYMGNPTGIYTPGNDPLYVFVDQDVPADATLYIAGCVENDLITNGKTGKKLTRGLNIVEGQKDALFYVVYTADTKAMTRTLDTWPELKIHIEGGVVNGYYDLSRHNDSDYQALLSAATLPRFTVRGAQSLYHLKTESFRSVFPKSIDKSICWFDSVAVWEKELMGMCENVARGERAAAPYFISGGDAVFPAYYNNPNFAIEGEESDAGYANSTPFRTSYNGLTCIRNCLDATNPNMDEWCAGHECGHNNQRAINLEGGTEASNNLFSNYVRYLSGLVTSTGSSLSTIMEEYARHEPFFTRDVNSQLRMYWQLYLYYHLAQHDITFYPRLFKALREDPVEVWKGGNVSSLKFVRKVCEVAQQDLTDFFRVWGFFEPLTNYPVEDYGPHTMTVRQSDIDATLDELAQYPTKNREILFVEDRVDYVPTTAFLTTPGQKRRGSEQVGQCGNVGQFSDYLPGACKSADYTYLRADSLFAMEGQGGLGFLMLDQSGTLRYAANAWNFCIPRSIGEGYTIYALNADGTLHESTKEGGGIAYITMPKPGSLLDSLSEHTIKAVISGKIHGTDIQHIRQMLKDGNLASIDLSSAQIINGGKAYYESYRTATNVVGDYAFQGFSKLYSICLPLGTTKINTNAFSRSGLKTIVIPDAVTTIGLDAFAYCPSLRTVLIGSKVRTMSQGVFYDSPIQDAYVTALTPPSVANYLFSSNPTIHVYPSALEKYEASRWAEFGHIVGDLTEELVDGIRQISASGEELQDGGRRADDGRDAGKCYDLLGRPVVTPRPHTLYIYKGKKHIAK